MHRVIVVILMLLLCACNSMHLRRYPAPSPAKIGVNTGVIAGGIIGGVTAGPPGVPVGMVAGGVFGITAGSVIQDQYKLAEWLQYHGVQVVEVGHQVKLIIPTDRFYRADSTRLNFQYLPVLDQVVAFIRHYSVSLIRIRGYTDRTSSWQYDLALSKLRAEIMLNYFTLAGIDARMMVAVGCGASNPIAPNTTRAGRSKNRRIEITFIKHKFIKEM